MDNVKILKIWSPKTFAVITLKFYRRECIQKMQTELQTV